MRLTTEIVWTARKGAYELKARPRGSKLEMTFGEDSKKVVVIGLHDLREFVADLTDALNVMTADTTLPEQ